MTLSRNFTNIINWLLDNLLPPIIRDSKLLFTHIFWLLFRRKYTDFMDFREKILSLNEEETIEYYKNLSDVHIKRETDLNKESVHYILNHIIGNSVLDISCGRGYLSKEIVKKHSIITTGMDFIINADLKDYENPKYIEGNIENIPFPDNHFDTVISTHTLEHVVNVQKSIAELRRVCKRKLIIVLPRQREYKFSFDLHVHFFPYKYSVLKLMNNKNGNCFNLKNDWLYFEDY